MNKIWFLVVKQFSDFWEGTEFQWKNL